MERKIIHIDMDAFFAAVEQRDNPQLKGKPVIVGGKPDSRGVVATCSYEARRFGVHSAMASSRAYQLCPNAVFVRPRIAAYRKVSQQIHQVFSGYSELVEPLSLDEAYLDVTDNPVCDGSATRMAEQIRKAIFQKTQLTASAGVSYNKFLAKIASDMNKPNGQYVIAPGQGEAFVRQLPIGKFYGVGKVTEAKMQSLGIYIGNDLWQLSRDDLAIQFGSAADYYYDIVRGIDHRPVTVSRQRKSLGSETTFESDLNDLREMRQHLLELSEQVANSLKQKQLLGYSITLKVKYADFQQITRSLTLDSPSNDAVQIAAVALVLLERTDANVRPVRLLGVSMSKLEGKGMQVTNRQLKLFE
ncbi:MAG: DNA polymerase IV [Gammaproteobacteria bacterium]